MTDPLTLHITNRLWRAIAGCFRERETVPEVMVWAKVRTDASRGKRHAITSIALTGDEVAAVRKLIAECADPWLQYAVRHEWEHNPQAPWWCGIERAELGAKGC